MSTAVPPCPAILDSGRRRGQVCGRSVVGFLAHGHGRCAKHLTARERIRVLAVVRAERELRELRAMALEGGECQGQPDTQCDEGAVRDVEFDAERFAGAELGE